MYHDIPTRYACAHRLNVLSGKLSHLSSLFTAYLEFDTFIPLSSSNWIHRFSRDFMYPAGIARRKKNKLYRSCSTKVSSPPSPFFLTSPVIPYPSPRPCQSFAARKGGDERRRAWIPRGDEDRCRALAYWQTFSNFTPIWPGAARQSFCAYLHPVATRRYTYVRR